MLHDSAVATLAAIRETRAQIEAELKRPFSKRTEPLTDAQLQSLLRTTKRQEREARRMV